MGFEGARRFEPSLSGVAGIGSVCKVGTKEPNYLDAKLKHLLSAWDPCLFLSFDFKGGSHVSWQVA